MQIVEMDVNDLNEYENNPRLNDDAVEYVASSITRVKAAKFLGMDTVPCIVADDLTEDQIKAFRLADNKVAEFSKWDMEALNVELDSIDLDMEEFGF